MTVASSEPEQNLSALLLTGQEWSDLADVVSDYWNKTEWVETGIWASQNPPSRIELIKRKRALCARIIGEV